MKVFCYILYYFSYIIYIILFILDILDDKDKDKDLFVEILLKNTIIYDI